MEEWDRKRREQIKTLRKESLRHRRHVNFAESDDYEMCDVTGLVAAQDDERRKAGNETKQSGTMCGNMRIVQSAVTKHAIYKGKTGAQAGLAGRTSKDHYIARVTQIDLMQENP